MQATSEVDGRRLRREQNREAVIDALVTLFERGRYQPTTNEIAAEAGISARSLFRYFDDVEDLSRAAIQRHLERSGPLFDLDVDAGAPLPEKIDAVVEQRAQLYDAIAPTARTARVVAHRNELVATQLRRMRGHLRCELQRVFGRDDIVAALDVLLSFETYELLRYDQGLSRSKTITTLTSAVAALLAS